MSSDVSTNVSAISIEKPDFYLKAEYLDTLRICERNGNAGVILTRRLLTETHITIEAV